jgi:hypothetical protein
MSHEYSKLYWTSFETEIDRQEQSPDCYIKSSPISSQQLGVNGTQGKEAEPTFTTMNDSIIDEDIPEDEGSDDDASCCSSEESEDDQSFQLLELIDQGEVTVTINKKTGKMSASVDPVTDYQLCGQILDDVNVWEFISHIEKRMIHSLEHKKKTFSDDDSDSDADHEIDTLFNGSRNDTEQDIDNQDGSLSDDLEMSDGEADTGDEDVEMEDGTTELDDVPFLSRKHQRPCATLRLPHRQHATHVLYVLHPDNRRIPVPTGPGLLRRDHDETRTRYQRLMLILFKPWRTVKDLWTEGQT